MCHNLPAGKVDNNALITAVFITRVYHDHRVNAMNPKINMYNFLTRTNKYTKRYHKNINKTLRQGGPSTSQYNIFVLFQIIDTSKQKDAGR